MQNTLYMAPVRGFTNNVFRNTYCEYFNGFDIAVAPFIPTINGRIIRKKHLKDILPENNTALPVIPQILGNDPDAFIQLAEKIFELGYNAVNWNIGCPFPMVAKKQRGSGLLPFPDKIDSFLERIFMQLEGKISVKTRTGRNDSGEIFKLIPVLNRYPIDEIIIHPRTGIQMYNGKADQEVFGECIELLHHKVVYNGDIETTENFQHLSSKFPSIHNWMIGRGAISNPFLPEMIIKTAGNSDMIIAGSSYKTNRFKQFHDTLYRRTRAKLDGPSHIVDKMKGYWMYFSRSFEDGSKLFKKIKKIKKEHQFQEIIENFFGTDPGWIS